MSNEKLRGLLQLVVNELICEVLNRCPRYTLYSDKIKNCFQNQIGSERVKKLQGMISSNGRRNPWKECSRLFDDFTCNYRNAFCLKGHKRNSSPCTYITEDVSIEDHRQNIFFEVIRIMLDCDLTDVNSKGLNDNTVLHLVVSLPTESEKHLNLNIRFLKLLSDASADCSLKNAQEMTPLHIITGNYLFDSHNGYVLSQIPSLTNECNTKGRLRMLQILEPFSKTPYLERGRYGNSILHEWVIYSSVIGKLSNVEKQIGEFIITQAKVPFYSANDFNCTALHYAFSTDVLQFLCCHKSEHDTTRLNSHGDTPVLHIMKYCILRQLISFVKSFNGVYIEEALAKEINIIISAELSEPHDDRRITTAEKPPPFESFIQTFNNNGFNVAALDSKGKNCLDYLLLFLDTLSTQRKETRLRIPDNLWNVVLNWIVGLTKTGSAFDNTVHREKSISRILFVLFEIGLAKASTEQMLVACINKLFESGADPNQISCPEDILKYCCSRNLSDNSLKKQVIELLCENGVHRTPGIRDDELQKVINNTKLKWNVKVEIQTVRYSRELDDLSREVHPNRIDHVHSIACRYSKVHIGKGATGVVFLAIDEKVKRELALKRIEKTSFTKEIKAEIKALRNLEQNANVINFYWIEETKDFYYLGIELMDGDLTDLVTYQKRKLADQELVRKLAADMLRGLEYLHKNGMIHRDIKPGNILYREIPSLTLKLADFGLTKHLECELSSVLATNSSSLCGTRGWMAPELITRKLKSPTKETDMFALGLVLHFLFSKGFHPFLSKEESLLKTLSADNFQAHKLELGITKNEIKIHHDLSFEQIHLVKILLRNNPEERHVSSGLLKAHCYFWSSVKKVAFISAVGDQPEVAAPAKYPSSTFESNLNNSAFGRSFSANAGWDQSVSTNLYQEMSRRKHYNTSSVTDLVRFFRNAYAHYEERSTSSKKEIMDDEILKRLPEFFVTVWMEVKSQKWDEPESQREKIMRVLNEQD